MGKVAEGAKSWAMAAWLFGAPAVVAAIVPGGLWAGLAVYAAGFAANAAGTLVVGLTVQGKMAGGMSLGEALAELAKEAVGVSRGAGREESMAMLAAAKMGDAAGVEAGLRAGADPNAMHVEGSRVDSALALAVSSGDEECVRMLAKGSNKRNREMAKLIARRMGAMALEEAIDSPKSASRGKSKPGGR